MSQQVCYWLVAGVLVRSLLLHMLSIDAAKQTFSGHSVANGASMPMLNSKIPWTGYGSLYTLVQRVHPAEHFSSSSFASPSGLLTLQLLTYESDRRAQPVSDHYLGP